ncbi:MAG: IS66 family insertion sequence element accessory protein TnpA, partial [Mangrovibacterium sp.]
GIPPTNYIFFTAGKLVSFAHMNRIEKREQTWMRRHYHLWQGSGLSQAQYCRENHIVLRKLLSFLRKTIN